MMIQRFSIKGHWDVIVIYDAPLGDTDVGFTHSDLNKRRSIVGISPASSHSDFINTVVHEAKHVQSHICRYFDVSEDSEKAAYLIGYIVQRMYKFFSKGMVK